MTSFLDSQIFEFIVIGKDGNITTNSPLPLTKIKDIMMLSPADYAVMITELEQTGKYLQKSESARNDPNDKRAIFIIDPHLVTISDPSSKSS